MSNKNDKILLVSFDIGKVNFAFVVEEVDKKKLNKILSLLDKFFQKN